MDVPTKIISIEGNIGSGKSTALEHFRRRYGGDAAARRCGVVFLPEPVSTWEDIRDDTGVGMLEKYYGNQDRYAFSFQMMAYISRLALLRRAMRSEPRPKAVVTERCVTTDKEVFAQMLVDEGKLETVEHKIYLEWFNEFIVDLPPVTHVYLRTSPGVCEERVRRRARASEQALEEGMSGYLALCHQYHDRWLMALDTNDVLVLDGNAHSEPSDKPGEGLYDGWLARVMLRTGMPAPPRTRRLNPDWHTLRFDGASRGNPGPCGAGYVLYSGRLPNSDASAPSVHVGSKLLSRGTNNWAEYHALILGLQAALKLGVRKLAIQGDSNLVVQQVAGAWAVRAPSLVPLCAQCRAALTELEAFTMEHIERKYNGAADKLANLALDESGD